MEIFIRNKIVTVRGIWINIVGWENFSQSYYYHIYCITVTKIWSNICQWSPGWFDQLEVAVCQWKTSQTCAFMKVICDVDQSACNFQVLIFTDINDQIQVALDSNLRSAILCALLCMKSSQFSAEELYMTITSLSYRGAILIATYI